MQSGSLSPILERHTPQYPLPDEIQQMGEEGTVCQFCGVSYLIHREIKKLEDRIQDLLEEIEKCKEAQKEGEACKAKLEESEERCKSLSARLGQSELQVRELENASDTLTVKYDSLADKSVSLERLCQSVQLKHQQYKSKILDRFGNLLKEVKETNSTVTHIKNEVKPYQAKFSEIINLAKISAVDAIAKFTAENMVSQKALEDMHQELNSKSKSEDLLQATIKLMENELKNAAQEKEQVCAEFKKENDRLQNQMVTFQNRNTELLQEVATLQSQLGLTRSDSAQIKEAFSKKQQEVQGILVKLHKSEKDSQVTIRRLNEEIKILEDDIQTMQKEKKSWLQTEKALLAQIDQLKSMLNSSAGESHQMSEIVENLKSELEKLKQERSQMITSHQSQISQLKETFLDKLKKANGDHELEQKIKELKENHKQELHELELHLMERYEIELGLLKEKHDEEMKSSMIKQKEIAESNSLEWKKQNKELANYSLVFQNQISALKSEYSQHLEENEKEKRDLKSIISNLENKITSLTGEQHDTTINLQVELRETKRKLLEVAEEKLQLEEKCSQFSEEVGVLQETVRRECEERFELTEALSQIQDQMKKTNTSEGSVVRTPVSAINRVSQRNSLSSSYNNLNGKQSLSNGYHQHSDSNSFDSTTSGNASAHVKDIMFSSPARNMSSSKSEELAENARRRIAAAIKRK